MNQDMQNLAESIERQLEPYWGELGLMFCTVTPLQMFEALLRRYEETRKDATVTREIINLITPHEKALGLSGSWHVIEGVKSLIRAAIPTHAPAEGKRAHPVGRETMLQWLAESYDDRRAGKQTAALAGLQDVVRSIINGGLNRE